MTSSRTSMALRLAVPTALALLVLSACASQPDRLRIGEGPLADQPHPTPAPRPTTAATGSADGTVTASGTPSRATSPEVVATTPTADVTAPATTVASPSPSPRRVEPSQPKPTATSSPTATTPPASPSPEPTPYTVPSGPGHSSTSVTASSVEGGGWEWTIVSAAVKQTRGEVAEPLRVHFDALRSDPDAGEPWLESTVCDAEVVAPDDRGLVADGTVLVQMRHGDDVIDETAIDITLELEPGERVALTTLGGPAFRPVYDRPVTCSLTFSSRR